MTSHLSSPLLQGGNIEQKKEGNGFLRKVLKSSDVKNITVVESHGEIGKYVPDEPADFNRGRQV